MFKILKHPPPPKSPSQLTFLFKPNTTADDATMNVIIWIHVFPF